MKNNQEEVLALQEMESNNTEMPAVWTPTVSSNLCISLISATVNSTISISCK